jgi:hypothetical protein
MVGTVEEADWFVRTMINRVGEWPGRANCGGSIARGSGRPTPSTAWAAETVGFRPVDSENAWLAERISGREVPQLPSLRQKEPPLSEAERCRNRCAAEAIG